MNKINKMRPKLNSTPKENSFTQLTQTTQNSTPGSRKRQEIEKQKSTSPKNNEIQYITKLNCGGLFNKLLPNRSCGYGTA
jgi:hypothetical protein